MKVAVIADTHTMGMSRTMPFSVWPHFETADHILHAGDVCDPALLEELKALAPLTVVMGNCDGWDVREWGATDEAEVGPRRHQDRDAARLGGQDRTVGADARAASPRHASSCSGTHISRGTRIAAVCCASTPGARRGRDRLRSRPWASYGSRTAKSRATSSRSSAFLVHQSCEWRHGFDVRNRVRKLSGVLLRLRARPFLRTWGRPGRAGP